MEEEEEIMEEGEEMEEGNEGNGPEDMGLVESPQVNSAWQVHKYSPFLSPLHSPLPLILCVCYA